MTACCVKIPDRQAVVFLHCRQKGHACGMRDHSMASAALKAFVCSIPCAVGAGICSKYSVYGIIYSSIVYSCSVYSCGIAYGCSTAYWHGVCISAACIKVCMGYIV